MLRASGSEFDKNALVSVLNFKKGVWQSRKVSNLPFYIPIAVRCNHLAYLNAYYLLHCNNFGNQKESCHQSHLFCLEKKMTKSKAYTTSSCYGGPQLSEQNQKLHGKNKNFTAKPKTLRQKQRPHGKNKYFRAKTKYLTAKANTHGKTKAILLLL